MPCSSCTYSSLAKIASRHLVRSTPGISTHEPVWNDSADVTSASLPPMRRLMLSWFERQIPLPYASEHKRSKWRFPMYEVLWSCICLCNLRWPLVVRLKASKTASSDPWRPKRHPTSPKTPPRCPKRRPRVPKTLPRTPPRPPKRPKIDPRPPEDSLKESFLCYPLFSSVCSSLTLLCSFFSLPSLFCSSLCPRLSFCSLFHTLSPLSCF